MCSRKHATVLFSFKSYILIVESSLVERICSWYGLGWNLTRWIRSVWSLKLWVQKHFSTSHTRTNESEEPVATKVPVASISMHNIGIFGTLNTFSHNFVRRFIRRIRLFWVAITISFECGKRQNADTLSRLSSSRLNRLSVTKPEVQSTIYTSLSFKQANISESFDKPNCMK